MYLYIIYYRLNPLKLTRPRHFYLRIILTLVVASMFSGSIRVRRSPIN